MNLILPIFAVLLRVFQTCLLVESSHQKNLVVQLVGKFASFREVYNFVTVCTTAFHWVLRPARLFTPVCRFRYKIITHVPMSKFSKSLLPCTLTPKCRGRVVVVFVTRRGLTAEARGRSHSGTCDVFDIGLRFLWTLRSPLSLSFHQYSFPVFFIYHWRRIVLVNDPEIEGCCSLAFIIVLIIFSAKV